MSPLTKLLAEVGTRIEELENENAKLRAEVKKVQYQLDDACDGIEERDKMITELQQMVSRAHEAAAQ